MSLRQREDHWNEIEHSTFDVIVIGAGINGARLYHHLCQAGYQVLLIDERDFSAGTSQASALLIWGGLLYLRNLDIEAVWRLCEARDTLIRERPESVRACGFRLVPQKRRGQMALLQAALYFYWLLGSCRRKRPCQEPAFPERELLKAPAAGYCLNYEEGVVESSDARLVGQWIFAHRSEGEVPLNYCRLEGGEYDRSAKAWRLDLTDTLQGGQRSTRARVVVNAAGVWTDSINERFRRESPYRHVFSKGVFLGLPRDPRHQLPLMVRSESQSDYLCLVPWGPISLWGPTETVIADPAQGFQIQPDDIRILLNEFHAHFAPRVTPAEIVSLRCGVRPLAVPRKYDCHGSSLHLTRGHRMHPDPERPWISIYGGKLTACAGLVRSVLRVIEGLLSPRGQKARGSDGAVPPVEYDRFPGLTQAVPAASWCLQNEMCYTLEDYLRRRTNIAQWVPRGGLGREDEYHRHVAGLAEVFQNGNGGPVPDPGAVYRRKIQHEFDEVLARC